MIDTDSNRPVDVYLSSQIVKAALVPALVLLPPPLPGTHRDAAREIGLLQRAECEYQGIAASYDEVTRAYLVEVYKGGRLIRWQARPSPRNPETETLVTAVFTAAEERERRESQRAIERKFKAR